MSGLQRSVIPSLDKTIESMNVLIKKCSQLYIPYNFKYKTYLNDFFSENVQIKNNVIYVRDWIYKSDKLYSGILENMLSESSNLNNIEIGRKYGSVK